MEYQKDFSERDLKQLSREELLEGYLKLQKLVEELQQEIEALKKKLDSHPRPPTTSKNSSQPPSRDQKTNSVKSHRTHRHGPPKGHEKHERQMISEPNRVIKLRNEHCEKCQAEMDGKERLIHLNQITEVPESRSQVIEVRQYEQTCPHCGRYQVVQPPAGLEMDRRFGSRLESTVVYYRQEQHMSYQRTQRAMHDLHGVEISQGGIDGIMHRTGNKGIVAAQPIQTTVRQSAVIYSDETGSRVAGDNWWEWVFCTGKAIWHEIRFDRSFDVIREFMETAQAEVWVSDCHGAQLKAPARQHQLCLAHQIRNLQAVMDGDPQLRWPRAMQFLFHYAIHLYNQRSTFSDTQFAAQVARVEYHCSRLLQRSLSSPDAKRLQKRYRKHRDKLFVFLYRQDVEPTNNVSERALRASVIHRKVTGCFRSAWGAKAFAALASVIDTAELSGCNAFAAIQSLTGSPSLPIPVGCE
jgi:transposase